MDVSKNHGLQDSERETNRKKNRYLRTRVEKQVKRKIFSFMDDLYSNKKNKTTFTKNGSE
jgi:hypothetical protein